jgi:hypothetical protein
MYKQVLMPSKENSGVKKKILVALGEKKKVIDGHTVNVIHYCHCHAAHAARQNERKKKKLIIKSKKNGTIH